MTPRTPGSARGLPVEEQLGYLSDLAQIRALLSRYASLVDARDPRAIASGAFTPDGSDDHGLYGSVFRGRDAIEAMFRRSNETTEASAHFVADPVIEIDGDVAYGRTYVTGWTWTLDSAAAGNVRPADWVFIGIYVDRLERTGDGWLISERTVEPLGPGATAAGSRPGVYAGSAGIIDEEGTSAPDGH
jgi:ketosteroid isomerase-like protein